MTSTLREAVLREIQDFWNKIAAQPDNDKIMGTPPDNLTIFESSAANFPQAACTGEFKAIEALDRTGGNRAVPFADPRQLAGAIRGAYWQHAQARLHISESRNIAVLELVFGPRYGRGYRFTRAVDGSIAQSDVWIS